MNGPTLAAITLTPSGDGVAVVAKLLTEALRERSNGGLSVVTMFDGPARRPSFADKVAFATRLDRRVLFGRPDWVLFSHIGLTRAVRFVPAQMRRPYAVFLHGVEAWEPLQAADRTMLAGASLRLSNSRYTAERVMRANPDIGPVVACPLALPQADAPDDTARPGSLPEAICNADAQIVLIVGALRSNERYKGHDQLIAAWPAVVATMPRAHLLIVGDGDDRARIASLAEESGVGRSISTPGFVDDDVLGACYQRSSIFAMPSRGEGFGLVYLEAMSHRLPCIGSRQDAAGEVIQDGVTGLLVDQHDVSGLAATIVSLLQSPERCRAMGLAGRERLQQEFTVAAFRARLAAALDQAFPACAA